ncbi:MAG: fibrinogen-like YCDxxxxGGGW domain-containing protein, partial [Myxococcota bacterium]|nr:fibrinogen-like YCDxxxxGGGW domain-containing protein [Myxococcota bacterium]
LDGEIAAWSIEIDTLSNQQVAVQGDLLVQGAITGPGGITVGSGTAPCDPAHAGSISFDTETQRLNLCTGTEVLQLKACSTQCKTPEAVLCGASITDGCDTPCEGTGTALNTTQCLVVAGTAGCGQPVTDECGNDCGLVGSSSDPAACPDTGTVPCSVAVLDPCGTACGTQGTGLNEALCAIPSNVACGVATTDPCGNDCSEQGTQCANKGLCVEGGCLLYGSAASNPGLSCADILATRPGISDGVYWIDPDGVGGDGSFEAYCDMTLDGGGWTLILNLDSDDGVRHDYTDETFWLTSNTEGQASEGLQHGFKGKAYQTSLPAESDLMILAHSESLTVGYATYTLLSEVQNESLLTMMSTFTDQTVSTSAIVQAGSVGAAHGDLFLGHQGALVINDASGWGSELTNNRIATTNTPAGIGHVYAGLGGQHREGSWGVLYESAPVTTYCTPDHHYGDLSNYAPHPSEGNMPYQNCGGTGAPLSIDFAIFFR